MIARRSVRDEAALLAEQGRVSDALTLLEASAARNEPDALYELALWRLAGSLIPRDLPGARDLFERAAAAGHAHGERTYNAFIANGTGGPSDWAAAVALLRQRAARSTEAAVQLAVIERMQLTATGDPVSVGAGRRLSSSPHVELFEQAFTELECRFLIASAEPLLQPAVIFDPQTGAQVRNPIRTSDAAHFTLMVEDPAVHALNRRIAALSRLAVDHGEPLQVLRYQPGQEYRAHHDALPATDNQRAVTALVYLNDDYSGGETHFLANGLSVRGRTGDMLLFHNVTSDGRPDRNATHAGLPVTRGVKYLASRWIRTRPLSLAGPAR